ncbi:thiosulfate/3-mercaptopyruvate sulfurtransferase [Actinomadura pelletieri DSM 43383]|uniref:Thiosulfate/3-mercaptopyruvate sulfurtransferase n=1 Tax=Actinomadura pelletieri DSM 43383 TaxID=1120940 RepID=A0A495QAK3_9ACTN|nr:thiosulfate/3-mercaptopyruvate sulfurtransferase [Actinomadura pelletieri DSM 43383]
MPEMKPDSPLPNPGDDGQTDRVHPLIEVPALDSLLRRQKPVVLLDVRWHLAGPPGIESYRRGHLPGAVFVDLDRDVAGPPGPGGRHPLPDAVAFESAMRRAGVSQDVLVVVYDDADSTAAARVWWSLRYFGHDKVRVLDGGYRAWTEAGRPVSAEEPEVKPGDFIANPGRLPVLDAEGAAELATAGVLLDARAAERYRGDQEPVDPVAGHIPGARNAPTSGNVGVDGRFLPSELLRERFAKLGVTDAVDVGAYCGSGVTAAHEILALHLAGIPAALYVGSWSNWVTDPSNPIATGDT